MIGRHDEDLSGAPLLSPVMLSGRRVDDKAVDLESIRAYAKEAIEALPSDHRSLAPPLAPYEIKISAKLARDQQAVRARLSAATKDGG